MTVAGVSINPVAFLVVQEGNVKLLPVNHSSAIDRLLDYVPDLFEKVNQVMNKNVNIKVKCDSEKEDINNNEEDNNKQKKDNKEKDYTYEFEYNETDDQDD